MVTKRIGLRNLNPKKSADKLDLRARKKNIIIMY
jgi:hypothetical protein